MNDQNKEHKGTVEWSFSFAELGGRIDDFIRDLGKSSGGEEPIRQTSIAEPLGGATSARMRIDLPVCKATVTSLPAGSANLIEADLTYIGEIKFAASGEAEKIVNLSQEAGPSDWMRGFFGWIGSRGELDWNIRLSPSVPLALDIHNGVGESTFDLSGLQTSELAIYGGTGEFKIILPRTSSLYSARVHGGVGEFEVIVPAGATTDLEIRGGTGEFDLEIGEGAAVTAVAKGGVGEFKVKLPQGAAARIEAKPGLGEVDAPPAFARVDSNVWQTVNYDSAERKILIRFEGGVGGLKVR